jgi:hypothetical protein
MKSSGSCFSSWASALVLTLSTPGLASAASPAELLSCGGLPCADLQVGAGKLLKLAIDTGNVTSVIDLAAAKAAGLPLTPYLDPNKNPVPGAFTVTIKGARLGPDTLGDITAVVADLSAPIAAGLFPRADGTLSYVALKDRRLVLDFRHHTIRAPTTGSACAGNCGTLTYPTFGPKGPPIVATTGFKVNGQPLTVQVDTLYSGTLLIYAASIEKLHFESQAATKDLQHFPFTDGGVDMIESKGREESFGTLNLLSDAPLYFPTPKVHQPDGRFDGTVGSALLAGHEVTFDFAANLFWVQ